MPQLTVEQTLLIARQHHQSGQLSQAEALYRQILQQHPNHPDAYSKLANALKNTGKLDDAIAACRQAIALAPNYATAYNNLGYALQAKGQFDAPLAALRQATALKPNDSGAYSNLGNILKEKGQIEEALAAFRQALALAPNIAGIHSNLIFTLHFHPAYDAPAIAEEHRRWNLRHAEQLQRFIQPHANDRHAVRRLRISYVSPDVRQRVQTLFAGEGIAPERVELAGWRQSEREHLALYHQVAIGLDPFPYHGTTTTCEALWMGVPVITLAGQTHVSRVGVSLLTNVGLPELIAESPADYVRIAAALAGDLPRLGHLRAALRQRMMESPLLDAPRFARNIEAAYRQMWRQWCATA